MTPDELQSIEAELQERGYTKWTRCLISTETYAWFKNFDKEEDDDGNIISGYQVAFRVWDYRAYQHLGKNISDYGIELWTSALGCDSRIDMTSNWEPIADIATFEHMAQEFNQLVRKYVNNEKK